LREPALQCLDDDANRAIINVSDHRVIEVAHEFVIGFVIALALSRPATVDVLAGGTNPAVAR
jgi:hypothetical protein